MRRLRPKRVGSQRRSHTTVKLPLLCALLMCNPVWADPVWHCSRNSSPEKNISLEAQQNLFSLAAINPSSDVIGVTLNDLLDVYSGIPVRIGGLPLSACFMPSQKGQTTVALTSLGLKPEAIQALARKSSIIQSPLRSVANEKQMLSCIAQNFPAVGYFEDSTETETVQPCF